MTPSGNAVGLLSVAASDTASVGWTAANGDDLPGNRTGGHTGLCLEFPQLHRWLSVCSVLQSAFVSRYLFAAGPGRIQGSPRPAIPNIYSYLSPGITWWKTMVDDIGGQVHRYECTECDAVRLLSFQKESVECKECSAMMEHNQGQVVENPASAMHQIEEEGRETKGEEDLRYR